MTFLSQQVHTDTETIQADVVVAAVNAKTLAALLPADCKSISSLLNQLPICDVATATLEYPRSEATQVPQVIFTYFLLVYIIAEQYN